MRYFICALMLALPLTANALVVSDPTAYTYYVQQIKNLEQQYQQMQKVSTTVDNIKQTLESGDIESVAKVQRQLEGAYNRATNAANEVNQVAVRLGATTPPLQEPDPSKDSMQWAGANYLKNRFKAPGEPGKTQLNRQERAAAQDYTYEQALLAANESLSKIKERFDTQVSFAEQIDKTVNVKDALDLGNRILLELVNIQTEMLAAINYMSAAIAVGQYRGLSNAKPTVKKNGGNFKEYLNQANGGKTVKFEDAFKVDAEW